MILSYAASGVLLDGAVDGIRGRVIHQDVQPAELVRERAHGRRQLVQLAHVQHAARRLPAGLADGLGHGIYRFLPAARHQHVRAGLRERVRHRLADALGRSGDEGHFAVEAEGVREVGHGDDGDG